MVQGAGSRDGQAIGPVRPDDQPSGLTGLFDTLWKTGKIAIQRHPPATQIEKPDHNLGHIADFKRDALE